MNRTADSILRVTEDRFERFQRIEWWDQQRLHDARVLVVGAGALGNEIIKNLALLGVGSVAIVDMDHIEPTNLARSVLFRERDRGRSKAEVAAEAAQAIYPDIWVKPLRGNLLADVGLGWLRWADTVAGALDNREARLFVNKSCALVGRPWIDGGIEVLSGIVRGFAPPRTACYECTMGQTDWDQLNRRRSCSLLARRAMAGGGTPTTPTTASVIGAIQAQEIVKRLHGLPALEGHGYVFEGLRHSSFTVSYQINPDCPWHDAAPPVERLGSFGLDTPVRELWRYAEQQLGGLDAIDLSREVVRALICSSCGTRWETFRPIDRIGVDEALCPQCGTERFPELMHSLAADSPELDLTARQLGLPMWDIVWSRYEERTLGMELAAEVTQGNIMR